MGKSYTSYTAGEVADNALSIVGTGNTIAQDRSIQMQDDTRIIGGDSFEMAVGSSLVQAGADYLGGNSVKAAGDYVSGYKVGDNSSLYLAQMDPNVSAVLQSSFGNTQSILDQAMTLVGLNSNNFMTLAAGRDPDKELADTSNEIATTGKSDAVKAWLKTTNGKIVLAAVMAGLIWKFSAKKGRK
jgi:hypothetical protein